MNKETIQQYTRKISEGNRSEIIVYVFEIGEIYMKDAVISFNDNNTADFALYCTKAVRCINDLLEALDYSNELAFPLMRIYQFMIKELSLAAVKYDVATVEKICELFSKMKQSFAEVAKSDTSAPVMANTQSVYAGLTYGKNSLNESISGDTNRGFKV